MDTSLILQQLTHLFHEELKENLVGVYLHGSLAMGCFNPKKSDIDLLVIVKDKLDVATKKRIARKLVGIDRALLNEGGIELSIVLETYVTDFIYPTPFELHYSKLYRETYKVDEDYVCEGMEDPDLAAHIFVTYHRGVTLYGKPIRETFRPIDRQYYVRSIMYDLEDTVNGIIHSPVYYVLNICRAWYFLEEGAVASKQEGGEWAKNKLPKTYKAIVQQCLDDYHGQTDHFRVPPKQLIEFARFMLKKINTLVEK